MISTLQRIAELFFKKIPAFVRSAGPKKAFRRVLLLPLLIVSPLSTSKPKRDDTDTSMGA